MILVDTSAWIEFFRGRDPLARAVDDLIETNEVALCGPVLTELRRGLRSKADRVRVLPLLHGCTLLEQPDDLFNEAGELGAFLGRKGATIKSFDLLIAIYALAHSAAVLSADADFITMKRCGVALALSEP